jgi:hypothetical protein
MVTRNTVVGIFDDYAAARQAVDALRDVGFQSADLGLTRREQVEDGSLEEVAGVRVGAGAATGALAGGTIGAITGWLAGIGALVVPGVGPILAVGPLAAALTGAAIGAAGGGLVGALTGMGIPEDEARWYESELSLGGTLVLVQAEHRYDEARRILLECGAREAGV